MTLASGRSAVVADSEILQRALISKSQFIESKKRLKPNVMSPNPHVELPVSRIDNLNDETIRKLADDVARKRGKESSLGYGRRRLTAALPRKFKLDTIPDEPPLHHANIVGWPSDNDPDEQRSRQLELAKLLVEEVELVLWKND